MQIRFNGFSIWGGHFKTGLIKTSFQHLILFCKILTLHNDDVGTFWNTRVPETKEEDGEKKLSQCSPRIVKRRRFSSFSAQSHQFCGAIWCRSWWNWLHSIALSKYETMKNVFRNVRIIWCDRKNPILRKIM